MGILLALVTATLVAALAEGVAPPLGLAPFAPGRFDPAA